MLLIFLELFDWVQKRSFVVDVRIGEEGELEELSCLCFIVSQRIEIAWPPHGCWEFVAVDGLNEEDMNVMRIKEISRNEGNKVERDGEIIIFFKKNKRRSFEPRGGGGPVRVERLCRGVSFAGSKRYVHASLIHGGCCV